MDDEQIYRFLLDAVALDVCFEVQELLFEEEIDRTAYNNYQMHRQISVDGLSLEELYDVEPIERRVDTLVVEQDGVFVSCLYCNQQVHASRYTNHLEKCMTGSRRMVTPKQRHDAAQETKRKQLQILSKPQLYGVELGFRVDYAADAP